MSQQQLRNTPPPPPPLLLNKRVTAFLQSNLSPQLRSAALTTPSGKLLAYASSQPVRILRRQCAVAASLWALHSTEAPVGGGGAVSRSSSSASSIGSGIPHPSKDEEVEQEQEEEGALEEGEEDADRGQPGKNHDKTPPLALLPPPKGRRNGTKSRRIDSVTSSRPVDAGGVEAGESTVTVQLDTGAVFVMRRLRCGMLFVCLGEGESTKEEQSHQQQQQQQQQRQRKETLSPPSLQSSEEGGSGNVEEDTETYSHSKEVTVTATSTRPIHSVPLVLRPGVADSSSEGDSILSRGTLEAATSGSQVTAAAGSFGTTGSTTGSIVIAGPSQSSSSRAAVAALRRHVDTLARQLDAKLGPLAVPVEGLEIGGWDLR